MMSEVCNILSINGFLHKSAIYIVITLELILYISLLLDNDCYYVGCYTHYKCTCITEQHYTLTL